MYVTTGLTASYPRVNNVAMANTKIFTLPPPSQLPIHIYGYSVSKLKERLEMKEEALLLLSSKPASSGVYAVFLADCCGVCREGILLLIGESAGRFLLLFLLLDPSIASVLLFNNCPFEEEEIRGVCGVALRILDGNGSSAFDGVFAGVEATAAGVVVVAVLP